MKSRGHPAIEFNDLGLEQQQDITRQFLISVNGVLKKIEGLVGMGKTKSQLKKIILKILNLYIIILCTNLYHFFTHRKIQTNNSKLLITLKPYRFIHFFEYF